MPKVFRSMKTDVSEKPVIEPTNKGLGVRYAPLSVRPDVDLDQDDKVILNGKGMSVAPNWRDLPPHLVSIRLRDKYPDAIGSPQLRCYTMGQGLFQDGPISDELKLMLTNSKHGVVGPRTLVLLDQFQADLVATRDLWSIEED
jgi:hypothetical protein